MIMHIKINTNKCGNVINNALPKKMVCYKSFITLSFHLSVESNSELLCFYITAESDWLMKNSRQFVIQAETKM